MTIEGFDIDSCDSLGDFDVILDSIETDLVRFNGRQFQLETGRCVRLRDLTTKLVELHSGALRGGEKGQSADDATLHRIVRLQRLAKAKASSRSVDNSLYSKRSKLGRLFHECINGLKQDSDYMSRVSTAYDSAAKSWSARDGSSNSRVEVLDDAVCYASVLGIGLSDAQIRGEEDLESVADAIALYPESPDSVDPKECESWQDLHNLIQDLSDGDRHNLWHRIQGGKKARSKLVHPLEKRVLQLYERDFRKAANPSDMEHLHFCQCVKALEALDPGERGKLKSKIDRYYGKSVQQVRGNAELMRRVRFRYHEHASQFNTELIQTRGDPRTSSQPYFRAGHDEFPTMKLYADLLELPLPNNIQAGQRPIPEQLSEMQYSSKSTEILRRSYILNQERVARQCSSRLSVVQGKLNARNLITDEEKSELKAEGDRLWAQLQECENIRMSDELFESLWKEQVSLLEQGGLFITEATKKAQAAFPTSEILEKATPTTFIQAGLPKVIEVFNHKVRVYNANLEVARLEKVIRETPLNALDALARENWTRILESRQRITEIQQNSEIYLTNTDTQLGLLAEIAMSSAAVGVELNAEQLDGSAALPYASPADLEMPSAEEVRSELQGVGELGYGGQLSLLEAWPSLWKRELLPKLGIVEGTSEYKQLKAWSDDADEW